MKIAISAESTIDLPKELLEKMQIGWIRPETYVKELTSSEQQLIEIAKALSRNPETIIFDLDNLSNNKIKSFKYVRSLTNKPIIVISSNNTDDIVLFFSLGADDYVVKPLSLKELIMRIQAIYNRNK